jgi:hypothetical protein
VSIFDDEIQNDRFFGSMVINEENSLFLGMYVFTHLIPTDEKKDIETDTSMSMDRLDVIEFID